MDSRLHALLDREDLAIQQEDASFGCGEDRREEHRLREKNPEIPPREPTDWYVPLMAIELELWKDQTSEKATKRGYCIPYGLERHP